MSARTFLVTGGAGFIGSHLSERLLGRGDEVIVLDDFSTGRRGNLDAAAPRAGLHVVEGDVRDGATVDRLVARADHVVHLAAAVGVGLVVGDPLGTIATNVHGTESVLRACGRRGTPVLVASSSEVYGRGVRTPFREDDDLVLGPPTRPRWSYAASKIVDEHLALAWHRERGLPVRVVRFFNTAGPRQSGAHGMVLARFVDEALAGGPLTVHGDGRQTRTFCHVADAVEAVLRLADAPAAAGRVVNVGGTCETSVRDLAAAVAAAAAPAGGAPPEIRCVPHSDAYGPSFDDVARRVPDVSRLRALTGFVPSRPLDEIVRDAVRWARAAQAAAA